MEGQGEGWRGGKGWDGRISGEMEGRERVGWKDKGRDGEEDKGTER